MTDGRRIALSLMDRLISGRLAVGDFCSRYENHFNFDWDDVELDPDIELFQLVFDTIVWYSPYAEEREKIPNYKGEDEVVDVVKSVRSRIAA